MKVTLKTNVSFMKFGIFPEWGYKTIHLIMPILEILLSGLLDTKLEPHPVDVLNVYMLFYGEIFSQFGYEHIETAPFEIIIVSP